MPYFYAARGIGGRKNHQKLYMHRLIMERILGRPLVKGEEVDHVNLNKRDNRRENLRLATHKDNMHNVGRLPTSTTGFKGVTRSKLCPSRPYRAYIVVNGKQKHLGHYSTPEEAHKAYCEAATKYYGEFARYE